jgi:agmatine deiminase
MPASTRPVPPASRVEPTPRALGFRLPAEWEPHAATWAAWPFDDVLWFGRLAGVRREFEALVRTIARFEPVRLLVHDAESEADAGRRLGALDVTLHRVPLDDVWFRDNGPLFVVDRAGRVSFVHWGFNAWGGKFEWRRDAEAPRAVAAALGVEHWRVEVVLEGGAIEPDGRGTALTTRQCLLSPTRNPGLDEAGHAAWLRDYLGIERLCWLERGLEDDHTDGHVDTLARFSDLRTLAVSLCEDPRDPNHEVTRANLERLRGFADAEGRPYRVVPVPLPAGRYAQEGERLAAAYVNFYAGNGFALVPLYDDPHDARALATLAPLFPGREVIGLRARDILVGGGGFHCLTQPQPAGPLWRGPEP